MLSKVFTATIQLLQLKLTSADPAQHLSALQAHLLTLIRKPESLPRQLSAALSPLEPKMNTVQYTANSLSNLATRVPSLAALPTAPTACAILMLALEGELSVSLSQAGALAQALGARVGASKVVVMQRYKAVYDLVEEYIRDVPWLDAHEKKGGGRSKVAKRVVVARGLKDVVQFQEEIWRKKLEAQTRPMLDIEVESNADGDEEDSQMSADHTIGMSVVSSQSGISSGQGAGAIHAPSQRKKAKTAHGRAIEEASQFLLNPLAKRVVSSTSRPRSKPPQSGELLEHFLTVDDSALSHAFAHPPTRLQLLTGSCGESAIPDEELFDEGELEGLIRSQDEVDVLRQTFDWDVSEQDDADATPKKSKKRKRCDTESKDDTVESEPKHTKRVNMDALARLLDPETNLDDFGDDEDFDALGLGLGLGLDEKDEDEQEDQDLPHAIVGGGDEEIEEWRPLSPGGEMFDEDRYDA